MRVLSLVPRGTWRGLAVALAVAGVALGLRLPRLEDRPLHHDEANQAWKTGQLLETGIYRYDPREHHGPSLYYLAWPLVRWQSGGRFADSEIWAYRVLPVIAGTVLVLLALTPAARAGLGTSAARVAALLTAISPAMVYFSRFFIQEMLLVTFTFGFLLCLGCGWRRPRWPWAVAAGACAGLMHATKETCILAWAALALAGVAMAAVTGRGRRPAEIVRQAREQAPLVLVGGLTAGLVSVLLFSSFLTYGRGPVDSVLTYAAYLARGTAEASHHRHGFGFYLGLLAYAHPGPRQTWGEDLILLLAGVGALRIWWRPGGLTGHLPTLRLLSLYTAALTVIYGLIPYKTPWCLLSFWHGWILLAGVGAEALLAAPRRRWGRVAIGLVLAIGLAQLAQRARAAAGRYAAHPGNPYAYAQTGSDFRRLVQRLEDLRACVAPDPPPRVHVIAPPDCTWPLPWYLRRFPQVGYWTEPAPAALDPAAAVWISTPDLVAAFPESLQQATVHEYYGLRPEVLLAVAIRRDLWDRFMASRQGGP